MMTDFSLMLISKVEVRHNSIAIVRRRGIVAHGAHQQNETGREVWRPAAGIVSSEWSRLSVGHNCCVHLGRLRHRRRRNRRRHCAILWDALR